MAKSMFWLALGLAGATNGCVPVESLVAFLRPTSVVAEGQRALAPSPQGPVLADDPNGGQDFCRVELRFPTGQPARLGSGWNEHVEIFLPKSAASHECTRSIVAWQIRGLYTEAVVRSPRDGMDYHCGLASGLGPRGYSLILPAPTGGVAGPARPKMARHTVLNDPHFTSLHDESRTLNPFTDPRIYFLGFSLLRTVRGGDSPARVAEALAPGSAAEPVGAVDQVPDLAPRIDMVRARFADLWSDPIAYRIGGGTGGGTVGATVHELPLEEGLRTRFFVWRIPFGATHVELGSSLPLGRLVLDIRSEDASGSFGSFESRQLLLQPGDAELALEHASGSNGLKWVK